MKSGNKIPLVSIIVPAYNVEKYLSRCLKSLIQQTYSNLEIIVVNDGSTDKTGDIAEKFRATDQRIKVIHQKNGGLSNARNNGLKNVNGAYISFVDSDDYVEKDYISFLYDLLVEDDFQSPLALCSLNDVYVATGKKHNCGDGSRRVLSGKECIKMMCYHDLVDTCAYAKLAKKELYIGFHFPEGKLFEDIGSTYLLLAQCNRVACGFSPKYNYMIRNNSIVTSGFNRNKLDLLEMTDKMADFVEKKFPDLKKAVLRRQVYARFSTLNQMVNVKTFSAEKKNMILFLKKNKKEVLADENVPRRDRIAYILLAFGYPIYKFGWNVYLKLKK